MNLRKKELDSQKLLNSTDIKPEVEPMNISPTDASAIVINGQSPPRSKQVPPASMPAFRENSDFGYVKKLTRKTSLKVRACGHGLYFFADTMCRKVENVLQTSRRMSPL
jgi:hypothetical protein